MTKPTSWTGVPHPHQNTLVKFGTFYTYNATIPIGYLTLAKTSYSALTFNFYGGGLANGLNIDSGTGNGVGDVVLNVIGASLDYHSFADSSNMRDNGGNLDINETGWTSYYHYGSMTVQAGDYGSTLSLSLQPSVSNTVGPMPPVQFFNYGTMAADPGAGNDVNNASNLFVTLGKKTVFSNYGTMKAWGAHSELVVWSAPSNSPNGIPASPFLSNLNNSGHIIVTNGGMAQFTTPVIGVGTMEIDSGSRIKLNGPVSTGQTINITAGTLEFGPKGSITNPSMQFMGRISGENAADTILLDGSYGVRNVFNVISTAGQGMAELHVFNPYNVQVADLRLIGHFQAADFSLTPHVGSTPTDNWTSITFTNHTNTACVHHS